MTENFVTDVVVLLEYYGAVAYSGCRRKTSAGTLLLIFLTKSQNN